MNFETRQELQPLHLEDAWETHSEDDALKLMDNLIDELLEMDYAKDEVQQIVAEYNQQFNTRFEFEDVEEQVKHIRNEVY